MPTGGIAMKNRKHSYSSWTSTQRAEVYPLIQKKLYGLSVTGNEMTALIQKDNSSIKLRSVAQVRTFIHKEVEKLKGEYKIFSDGCKSKLENGSILTDAERKKFETASKILNAKDNSQKRNTVPVSILNILKIFIEQKRVPNTVECLNAINQLSPRLRKCLPEELQEIVRKEIGSN